MLLMLMLLLLEDRIFILLRATIMDVSFGIVLPLESFIGCVATRCIDPISSLDGHLALLESVL